MHATPPTPTMPATGVRLVTFGSSKTILRVDQQYPGVIRVPESKDGFDNAKHERTLEGVGPRPGLGAGDGKTRCLRACSTALVPPPLALHLLLQRGEELPISPLGDELLRGAFNHPGLMQAQGVEA